MKIRIGQASIFARAIVGISIRYNNKNANNNITKRAGRGVPGACSVRAFNLHGINRVSGRARNANTRYRLRPRPSDPSSDRREKDSRTLAPCRIV